MTAVCGTTIYHIIDILYPCSELSWSSVDEREGLTLDYPRICVHAVSRDTSVFPSPCVYLLYSATPPESSSEEDADMEESPPLEIRLVPPHADHCMYCIVLFSYCMNTVCGYLPVVETIYSAICDCQLLYPDPEQSDSDEEDEVEGGDIEELQECPEDFFTSAEGLQHLTAEGEAVLAHLESILQISDQPPQNGNNIIVYLCLAHALLSLPMPCS